MLEALHRGERPPTSDADARLLKISDAQKQRASQLELPAHVWLRVIDADQKHASPVMGEIKKLVYA